MPVPTDLSPIAPGIFLWQHYDPKVKADLYSHAIATFPGLFLIDPIPLSPDGLTALANLGPVAGILITNSNHSRATADYAARFNIPVFAHRDSIASLEFKEATAIEDGQRIGGELHVVTIDGAPMGEVAIYHPSTRTMMIGDALINFDPHGFAFLPRKYCTDFNRMRRSLRKLLPYDAERFTFAHGAPILSGGTARLFELLEGC